MSIEVYNNFKLQKAAALDSRLNPVATFGDLPNISSNFLYLGAVVYVTSEAADYKVTDVSSVLTWVKQEVVTLGAGTINILDTDNTIDLSMVSPVIAKCNVVTVNISGSNSSAAIYTILNAPTHDFEIRVQNGKQINFMHTDYTSANNGDIVFEDGYNFNLRGRSVGNESIIFRKNGTAVVQVGATQFLTASEWSQNLLNIAITDNLSSSSTTTALSANQGQVLDTKKQNNLNPGFHINLTNETNDTTTVDVLPFNKLNHDIYDDLNIRVIGTSLVTVAWLKGGNVGTYLTNFYSGVAQDTDTVVDLNVPSENMLLGKWCLPAGETPTNINKWFLDDSNIYNLKAVSNTPTSSYTRQSADNKIYIMWKSMTASSYMGSLKGAVTQDGVNLPSYSHQFTSFSFNNPVVGEMYEIEINILYAFVGSPVGSVYLDLLSRASSVTALSDNPYGVANTVLDTDTAAFSIQNNKLTVKTVYTYSTAQPWIVAVLKAPNVTDLDGAIINASLVITKIN